MNEEELLRRNNVFLSHGKLPYDMSTCETYGISGNCGKKCPNFKNKTCEVYIDVLERIVADLETKINATIEFIGELDDNTDDTICYDIDKNTKEDLLNILKEKGE